MAVRVPATRTQVHLDVAAPRRPFADLDHRRTKIRSALDVEEARVEHADGLAVEGFEFIAAHALVLPDSLQEAFGRGVALVAQDGHDAATDAPLGVKAVLVRRHLGLGCARLAPQCQASCMS
jgi:hypothetical protein